MSNHSNKSVWPFSYQALRKVSPGMGQLNPMISLISKVFLKATWQLSVWISKSASRLCPAILSSILVGLLKSS